MGATSDDPTLSEALSLLEAKGQLSAQHLEALAGCTHLYNLLGVGVRATDDEIAAAYKERALRLHPDRHARSAHLHLFKEAFEALGRARKLLSDRVDRKAYDLKKGFTTEQSRFSMDVLRKMQEEEAEVRREVAYKAYLASQRKNAKEIEEHRQRQVIEQKGAVLAAAKRHILQEKEEKSLGWEEAAAYASTYLDKPVAAEEVEKWAAQAAAAEEEEALTMEALQATSALFENGKFKGLQSFDQLKELYAARQEGSAEGNEPDLPANASAALRENILKARARRREAEEAKKAEQRAAQEAAEAQRKRRREEVLQEAEQAATKKAKLTDTEGFEVVKPVAGRRPPGGPPAAQPGGGGVAGAIAALNAVAAANASDDEDDDDDGGGGGIGGFLAGYGSD